MMGILLRIGKDFRKKTTNFKTHEEFPHMIDGRKQGKYFGENIIFGTEYVFMPMN